MRGRDCLVCHSLSARAAKQANAGATEQLQKAAAQVEKEKAALADVRGKAVALCRDWKFKEARAALARLSVISRLRNVADTCPTIHIATDAMSQASDVASGRSHTDAERIQ